VSEEPLHFGRVELRPQERRLLVDGQPQVLGARAFDLLLALAQRRERVVTKNELLELVWPGLVVEESNLPVHVSTLRKVLGTQAIVTIPGRGYRFTLPSGAGVAAAPGPAPPPDRSSVGPGPIGPQSAPAPGRYDQPLEAEPIIGREEAVYDIVATLLEHRLVSIVGAGGVGKTRLARAVLRRLLEDFVDGVWWVDLAAVQHGAHVVRAIAQSVGEALGSGDAPAALARALAHRQRMLLVLDNCEQVASGVAPVAAALLHELPMVRLLLTSRVPLHLPAEQVWRLEALPVPAVGATLEEARGCGAFELFELRARAHDHRFVIDRGQLAAAIELCRRLEGHPLAIEMAAARAPQIGLLPLLGLLGDRLRLLRASDPAQPERQLSLRAMLDWSYSQLDEAQRAVLRRLSVFAGRFGLDAAQQVAADSQLDEWAVLDALAALVDHSLVQAELGRSPIAPALPSTPGAATPDAQPATADTGTPRYRLAETTRLYALEQLRASNEASRTEARYSLAMARVADQAAEAVWALPQVGWLERFGADQDDLQIVFDAACARGDAAIAARTGQALAAYDAVRGPAAGARDRAAAARPLLVAESGAQTLALLWNLVAPPWSLEQPLDVVMEDGQARAAACRRAGDARQLYLALRDLALVCARDGRHDEALAEASEMSALEDPGWPAALRIEGAQVHADVHSAGAKESGPQALLRALQLAQRIGDKHRQAWLRLRLAEWATAEGPAEEAVRLGRSAVLALEPLHRPLALGTAWSHLCAAALFMGDDEAARRAAAAAYPLLQSSPFGKALFHHLALLEARSGHAELAAILLGHAESSSPGAALWRCRSIMARLRALTLAAIPPDVHPAGQVLLDDTEADAMAWAALGGRESAGV
jgi:predicted ATPase